MTYDEPKTEELDRRSRAAIYGLALFFVLLTSVGVFVVYSKDANGFSTDDNETSQVDSNILALVAENEIEAERLKVEAVEAEKALEEMLPEKNGAVDFSAVANLNPLFSENETLTAGEVNLTTPGVLAPTDVPDNGDSPKGQFRVTCAYSHFGKDDPILFPGEPDKSHLHTFFGNTKTDAYSTAETLLNSGGGTCQGGVLNRSAYWTPTLLNGQGSAIVPELIVLYYKTDMPAKAQALPQGLQMVAGNFDPAGFETSDLLNWSCGDSGQTTAGPTNRIIDCPSVPGDGFPKNYLVSSVQFPNCWDAINLATEDFSHLALVDDWQECPVGWQRMPQITILQYFDNADSTQGWHLSSDDPNGIRGATLHADWFGAWNEQAMDLFINGCIKPPKNCSLGQTGTNKMFSSIGSNGKHLGEQVLELPDEAEFN